MLQLVHFQMWNRLNDPDLRSFRNHEFGALQLAHRFTSANRHVDFIRHHIRVASDRLFVKGVLIFDPSLWGREIKPLVLEIDVSLLLLLRVTRGCEPSLTASLLSHHRVFRPALISRLAFLLQLAGQVFDSVVAVVIAHIRIANFAITIAHMA